MRAQDAPSSPAPASHADRSPMKFTETLVYPMPLDELEAMSLDPAFLRSRFARFTSGLDVAVEGRTIRASGPLDMRLVPPAARAFVSESTRVEFTETWSGEGGARTCSSTLKATGAPVSAALSSTFADGGSTTRTVNGELKISVPFFGGKLEKEGVARAGLILKEEQRLAAAYLDSRP